jgi:membrane protease YdiL (CAAX protease family)
MEAASDLTTQPAVRWPMWAWISVLVGTLAVALVTEVGAGLILRRVGTFHHTAWGVAIVVTLRETAALAVFLALARNRLGLGLGDFVFRRPRAADVGVALVATVVTMLILTPLSWLVPRSAPSPIALAMYHGTLPSRLVLAVNVALYSPAVQELIFRGLVLTALLQRMDSRIAIAVSAVLFALVHAPDVTSIATALPFGFLAGWLFVRSRSLWTPIVSHVLINGTSMVWLIAYYMARGR